MFNPERLIIRPATLEDIDFVVTAIIESEKSSTDKIGPANYFEITEADYRRYLIQMLEEEIDGCEISISSFVVAEYEGEIVAATGGWLEGDNEDGLPSSMIKSNLFAYFLPKENLLKGQNNYDIVKGLMIEREMGTYQLEYSYTKPEFRGFHIMSMLDAYHINNARKKGAKKTQVHVSKGNAKGIKARERSGFNVVGNFTSYHPQVKDYYPDDTIVLLEKKL